MIHFVRSGTESNGKNINTYLINTLINLVSIIGQGPQRVLALATEEIKDSLSDFKEFMLKERRCIPRKELISNVNVK